MITSRIMVLTYDLQEDGHKDDVSTNNGFLFFFLSNVTNGFHVAVSLYSNEPQDVT